MPISSNDFYREFKKCFKARMKEIDWNEIGKSNGEWSVQMLGNSETWKDGNYGLIGVVADKFRYVPIRGYMQLDQVWYPKNDKHERIEVIIKHEHKQTVARFKYDLKKLMYFKAKLKIGIFYFKKEEELKKALKNTTELIKIYVDRNSEEKYLVLDGWYDEDPYFEAYEFDAEGDRVNLF